MTPSEASQVKKLRAALEAAIPREWQGRWQGVAGWFWLSEDEKGIGAGAQAFDADGNATGFSLPVKPLRDTVSILTLIQGNRFSHLNNLRACHGDSERHSSSRKPFSRFHCAE
jgi:hypothetical protein